MAMTDFITRLREARVGVATVKFVVQEMASLTEEEQRLALLLLNNAAKIERLIEAASEWTKWGHGENIPAQGLIAFTAQKDALAALNENADE